MIRLLGIDPGLRFTGWGLIDVDGNRLKHVADGVIATDNTMSVPARLKILHDALMALLAQHRPAEAAVEETYVNRNGAATLKLGYARGVALLTPALAGRSGHRICRQNGQAGGRRHRRRGKGAGRHDGAPASPGRHAPPSRRVGCAGGGDLPRASPVLPMPRPGPPAKAAVGSI